MLVSEEPRGLGGAAGQLPGAATTTPTEKSGFFPLVGPGAGHWAL